MIIVGRKSFTDKLVVEDVFMMGALGQWRFAEPSVRGEIQHLGSGRRAAHLLDRKPGDVPPRRPPTLRECVSRGTKWPADQMQSSQTLKLQTSAEQ